MREIFTARAERNEPTARGESADESFAHLVDGFRRFRAEVYPEQQALFARLAKAQQPRAMFITCADSRIVPELITQSSPGDLFVTRNVGNVVPPYGQMNGGVSSAIEYAVMALDVQHIIVCGHSDCGAMKAVLDPAGLQRMPTVKAWLRHCEVARSLVEQNCSCAAGEALGVLTEENVVAQLDHLRTHPSVATRLAGGQLSIHGWVYCIETSEILAYDATSGRFAPLDGDGPLPVATPAPRYLQA
ncbi:carbonic anhydrase [Stutzerimonas kunmingensis]|uniref:carbonic anhydrase n=1 Tax=Stutzerimonas kunmingensis TaxID=1211807 RepID=UPI0021029F37|nr:carbonic anhydrase [Stutzerimonas kunmingensis]MCQ2033201.1 carbonic anhydrase [Stutzerimonas kunmingensis]